MWGVQGGQDVRLRSHIHAPSAEILKSRGILKTASGGKRLQWCIPDISTFAPDGDGSVLSPVLRPFKICGCLSRVPFAILVISFASFNTHPWCRYHTRSSSVGKIALVVFVVATYIWYEQHSIFFSKQRKNTSGTTSTGKQQQQKVGEK